MSKMERLDKLLSSRADLSRRDAKNKIKNGEVAVNGRICRNPEQKLDAATDTVELNGQAVDLDEHIYIMLNKPAGVVSATRDNRDKTVIDILPPDLKRPGLFPAGRLDKDTEGLLIITDDGELAHKMLSPKKHVDKKYIAKLGGEITAETIERFEQGIVFADGTKCLPAKLETDEKYGSSTGIVTICEGKFHQVKKMFAVCGLKVVHLQRISVGNLYLDSKLPIGSAKKLTKLDVSSIFVGKIH